MSALEAMKTSKTTKNLSEPATNKHIFLQCLAVFGLDVLFIYFFQPSNPLFALLLAMTLWQITREDYKHQTIDIRWVAVFFFIGLFCRGGSPWYYIYAGLLGFFIPHILHELFAATEKIPDRTVQGSIHFVPMSSDLDENEAPPYVPYFVGTLSLILFYYLLALPMSPQIEFTIFAHTVFADMVIPWQMWLIPLGLGLISVFLHYRARYFMKRGYNIVYRGFGDGDIYFLGAMIGIFGLFITLLTIFLSMFPAYYASQKWQRRKR